MVDAAERLAALGLPLLWLRGPRPAQNPPHGYREPCTCPPNCGWDGERWRGRGEPVHSPDAECTCPPACRWAGVGKAPLAKGWQRAPWASPEELRASYRAGNNLGVHAGLVEGAPLSVVVLDGDSAEALEVMRRRLPKTPIRTVTRTGEHWYYKHPGTGVTIDTRAHVDGIPLDIRADGGQVVVAPSRHPSGHVYAEAQPWTAEAIAEMPTYDPAWFRRAAPPPPPRPPRTWDGDREQLRRRAVAYARKAEPAVEGQGGSTVTFKLAGHLVHELGLTVDEALDVMAAEWNGRCSPPWEIEGQQGLRRKVQEAADKARSFQPGRLRDAERSPRRRRAAAVDEVPPDLDQVPLEVREADAPARRGRARLSVVPRAGGPAAPQKPQIETSALIYIMRDQAIEALVESAAPIYQRLGELVDVIGSRPPTIRTVPRGHLLALLSEAAEWLRFDPRREQWTSTMPPREVLAAVFERGEWPGLRELRGVVETPVLRPDGSILDVPGYDLQTALYYAPAAEYLPVPQSPTAGELRAALELLGEVTCDFPFANEEAGHSAWLALVLTMLARPAIIGPAPLFLIDGNTPGTGKTLLVDAAHHIAHGGELEKTAQGKDAEEDAKVLLGLALAGVPVVLFDNVAKPLGNATLDMALTAGAVRGRVLGKNESARVPFRATWAATGNNIRLRGDMARRCLRVRLICEEAKPEQRENFRHPQLLAWIAAQRPRLVQAALIVLRAYFAAGARPPRMVPLGGFEAWSVLVRGAITAAGLPDPLLCNDADHDESNDELAALPELIEGWADLCRGMSTTWCSTADAVRRLHERRDGHWVYPLPRLRDALAELFGPEVPSARQLGNLLKKYRDRRLPGGRAITVARDKDARGWGVTSDRAATSGGPHEDIAEVIPNPA